MRLVTFFILVIIIISVFHCKRRNQKNILEELLQNNLEKFEEIMKNPEAFKVQILYTQINRDHNNQPEFVTFKYHVNNDIYFYPASTVKLPVAVLALQKINQLAIKDLTKYSIMLTDSAYSGQTKINIDSSAENNLPSVAHYIKKIFLISDNDAFNRLYEFLGLSYINKSLVSKGYDDSRITHRLSIPLSLEENQYTNPVRFYDNENQLIYQQDLVYTTENFFSKDQILLGDGHILADSLIRGPMDFSTKNYIPLDELHQMLISLIFPESITETNRFFLTSEDYEFLYTYMSMHPRESNDPYYGDQYEDNYCKFLMFGDRNGRIPENLRIFNKIGLAYGFLVESAYIVDFVAQLEFFLSAVIHVNENRIYNDGLYEYDSIGFPFMGNLGRMIYQFEKERSRQYVPDLSRFNISYDK